MNDPSEVLTRSPLRAAWREASTEVCLRASLAHARRRIEEQWARQDPSLSRELRGRAEAERGTAWPQPLVTRYARFFRDGNRTDYESLVGARQHRLTRAALMAWQHPERLDWLDEVVDGAYLLCEQSSWSWAAHDDVFTRKARVVPDPDDPYLDLGAGEVAAQLAWIDLLLGSRLDERAPGVRERIRSETNTRVFIPFLERVDWHWLGLDGDVHNWNPWIHSNVLAAGLLLEDNPDRKAQLAARVIEGLDRFLASMPMDGAIDEGFAYWWNGAGRALEALELLETATDGVLDGNLPITRALVRFPHRMHLGSSFFLNVADGPGRASDTLPWELVHRWAERLHDDDARRHARAMMNPVPATDGGLFRAMHAVTFNDDSPADPPLVAFTYLESVQIMVARETAGSAKGLALTAKGGHNGEHHNHLDVGSITVAVDGVPLLVDAGQPTYTAQTFGPDRYSIRAMQSGWHSTPAPWGLSQGVGRDYAAVVVSEPGAERPTMAMRLEGAYRLPAGSHWLRTASLHREAVGSARITDEWALSGGANANDVDIHNLLAGHLTLLEPGMVTVQSAGIPGVVGCRGAILRWDADIAEVLIDYWELDDPLLSDVWGKRLTRLTFRMAPKHRANGSFTLEVKANDE